MKHWSWKGRLLAAALLAAGAGLTAGAEGPIPGAPLEEGRRLLEEATDALFEQSLPSSGLRELLQGSDEAFVLVEDIAARLYWQAEVQYLLGFVERSDGRPDQAQRRFERGRDLLLSSLQRRESSQAYRLLADTYAQLLILNGLLYKMSYGPKVREMAEAALRLDPTDAKARLTLALFYKNAPAIAGGSRAKSLELLHSLEKERELARVDRFSLNAWLGILYSESRRPEEARRYLTRALQVYPGNAWMQDLLRAL
jgi:tetratricopeptide (TPR) repeat protein